MGKLYKEKKTTEWGKKKKKCENGFEIRDLHHFAIKNVPHTISQILRATEIQQFRSNQLLTKNQ